MVPKTAPFRTLFIILTAALLAGSVFAFQPAAPVQAAQQIDIHGAVGGRFGDTVTVLSNGNLVVTDPYYDVGDQQDVGAAFLIDGKTGDILSTLTGSAANDQAGASGVVALHNGNYVVRSSSWNSGVGAVTWCIGTNGCSGGISLANSLSGDGDIVELKNGSYVVINQNWHNATGAVTFCSGTKSCAGEVSAANSLVGSTADDGIGSVFVALSNGNYVTGSSYWDNGSVKDAGAVTWCSGATGCAGTISAANSLVGSHPDDTIGYFVSELRDGNFVVSSDSWDSTAAINAGAVTFCSGTAGCRGVVSADNSLVGTQRDDIIGTFQELSGGGYAITSPYWNNGTGAVTWCSGINDCRGTISAANSLTGSQAGDGIGTLTDLGNGKYVISSPGWDNGAGAVMLCGSAADCTGKVVSAANSLVGSQAGDQVGNYGITGLSSGNYVVASAFWDSGSIQDVGAVTWCSGTAGCQGVVSAANSLVGSQVQDEVGYGNTTEPSITALSSGNYVVVSSDWDDGAVPNVGAVTWCSGTSGCHGVVSTANSLVGGQAYDQVGFDVNSIDITALSNGNYVVGSPYWDSGSIQDVGAVTWCSGTAGCQGVVSAANSLVGSQAGDAVGSYNPMFDYLAKTIIKLKNGNYVVNSLLWDNGAIPDAGAVTWCHGTTGCRGEITAANSLVGSSAYDWVGWIASELKNGSYLAISPGWDNGAAADAGAVTWCSPTGCTGTISAANSLVGSQNYDYVGYNKAGSLEILDSGDYILNSPDWDNGTIPDAGAVTWCNGPRGCQGFITRSNSVLGMASPEYAQRMRFAYDPVNRQLVVGRPFEQIVSLFRLYVAGKNKLYLPAVFR